MSPAQSKQAAAIMQKFGDDGWMIEAANVGGCPKWLPTTCPSWNWQDRLYRAVCTERLATQRHLPIEHYKRGMEIHFADANRLLIRDGAKGENELGQTIANLVFDGGGLIPVGCVKRWRWPHESKWHDAYTETIAARVVKTLVVDGL